MHRRGIIETSKVAEYVRKVLPIVFVGRASQAPQDSMRELAEDRHPIIPLVARAGRSHVRGIARPVGEKRESFKKFADYDHFARLVPAKLSSSPVVCCTRLVNSHTKL